APDAAGGGQYTPAAGASTGQRTTSNSPANYVPSANGNPQFVPPGTYPDGKGGYIGIPDTSGGNPVITPPDTGTQTVGAGPGARAPVGPASQAPSPVGVPVPAD